MSIRLVAGASALALSSVAFGQQAVQWRVEDGGNGHWYRRIDGSFSWITARDACVQRGGYLATPTSAAENTVAHSVNQGNCWIGGFQPPKTCEPYCGWQWVTGEPWVYTNWDPPNQPDDFEGQDHLIYWTGDRWADIQGSVTASCICEWSADCNGDGIVDYGQCRDGSLPDYNGNNTPDCCEAGVPCVVGNYPVQWREDEGGNGHWYQFSTQSLAWSAARDFAVSKGGHLVTTTSEAESLFVFSVDPDFQSSQYWLGLFRSGGTWTWVTGEPVQYVSWNCQHCHPSCQPDFAGEDVVNAMCWDGTAVRWNNHGGWPISHFGLMMEWSADCDGNGVVDYGEILDGTLGDANANGIPDCCEEGTSCDPCLGDVTGNGLVDALDLAAVLGAWGTNGKGEFPTDRNNDGIVNAQDLALVLSGWGKCP
jgi:hypothetical protein